MSDQCLGVVLNRRNFCRCLGYPDEKLKDSQNPRIPVEMYSDGLLAWAIFPWLSEDILLHRCLSWCLDFPSVEAAPQCVSALAIQSPWLWYIPSDSGKSGSW